MSRFEHARKTQSIIAHYVLSINHYLSPIGPPGISAAFMLPDLSAGAVQLDDELKIAARNESMAVGQSDGRRGSLGAGLPITLPWGMELADEIRTVSGTTTAPVRQSV